MTPPKHGIENDTNTSQPQKPLTLRLDMEKYLGQIDDWGYSEFQGQEFVAALWELLRTFAEIGFQMHPVQQAKNTCGKLSKKSANAALSRPNALYSKGRKSKQIGKDFGASAASETERIQP